MATDTRSTQFFGIQITLAGSAVTSLITALRAVDANVPAALREVTIQADVATTGTLLIGDAALSTSRYGLAIISTATLNPFVQFGEGSNIQNVPIGAIYLLSSANMKVNVLAFA